MKTVIFHAVEDDIETRSLQETLCGRPLRDRIVRIKRSVFTPEKETSLFPGDRFCGLCKKIKKRFDLEDAARRLLERKRHAVLLCKLGDFLQLFQAFNADDNVRNGRIGTHVLWAECVNGLPDAALETYLRAVGKLPDGWDNRLQTLIDEAARSTT